MHMYTYLVNNNSLDFGRVVLGFGRNVEHHEQMVDTTHEHIVHKVHILFGPYHQELFPG